MEFYFTVRQGAHRITWATGAGSFKRLLGGGPRLVP
jgi:hypothetical protein